jgi:hypothetical protein
MSGPENYYRQLLPTRQRQQQDYSRLELEANKGRAKLMIDAQQRYRGTPERAWRNMDEGGMALHLQAHDLIRKSPENAFIWEELEVPCTVQELTERLMSKFGVGADEADMAVRTLLVELEVHDLVATV